MGQEDWVDLGQVHDAGRQRVKDGAFVELFLGNPQAFGSWTE